MTSVLSLFTSSAAAAGTLPPGKGDLATLAKTADVPTLTVHVRQHPQDRDALESAMVRAGRSGDVSRMAQALKTPDYEVAVWNRYGKIGGPAFPNRAAGDPAFRVGESAAWETLQAAGKVTAPERHVISHMSASEGRLDSVQAYDNQIVSVGAMQKTVNPQGTGEFPRQVWDFKEANPDKYRTLFADRGWTVERVAKGHSDASFALRLTVDGKTPTAPETAAYIKDRSAPDHWGTALDPLQKAGRDPDFQAQQIKDFQTRLTAAVGTVPAGAAYTRPAGDYVTSEQGAAMILNHHVNRPAHVDNAFGAALDTFYAANPKASRDPATWTAEQRTTYEADILANYSTERASTNYKPQMTHATERAERIMGPSSPLSAVPGSFTRTATP
ncbi:hypothetical protein KCP91_13495 [Microvirga sp. SRT01]|uniref:Uncharacterized protein n=1 Tax=Sphingomonas longa TaxID=2778730 RepID=A0ABS2D916_9SPHN|nr:MULTISPECIES: hypothetical protein [Alphaproteobacteria]MBM6577393.1 hypothetical protein [Sphingomonas sp. BT552]MBR7710438.1 hypothetical protein [Microvirga sp. SRT01]